MRMYNYLYDFTQQGRPIRIFEERSIGHPFFKIGIRFGLDGLPLR
jgi:hypothetical protein